MSTATNPMSIQDATAHMLAPTGPSGNDGLPTNSMPILQPVFIPRQAGNLLQQTNAPTSPGSLAASASADWAFLLRNAAAMNTSGANGTPALDMAQLTASANNNLHELVSGRRSPPQIQSSPNVFYSPMASTGPSAIFNSSSMVDFTGGMGQDAFAAAAAAADANGLAAMHLSNNSNLSSSISAAAAMYGDGGVQTLYGSNNQLALAAAGAAAARQTQTLLQQQQAAVNSLNSGIGTLSLGGGMTNGLGKIEESLSGSLFSAAAAAAAAAAAGQAAAQKPVSSSLYIKNLPPDADKLFLYEKFSPYGAILSVKVLNDPHSGQCRGVGFVNFAEHQSALRSIQALHGSKVGDKLMHVSLQTPRIRASAVQMP